MDGGRDKRRESHRTIEEGNKKGGIGMKYERWEESSVRERRGEIQKRGGTERICERKRNGECFG